MGASKKKAKFIAKGHLATKLKQRNVKKKFQAMKDKKKNRFERNSDAPTKKKPVNEAAIAMHGDVAKKKKVDTDMLDEMDVEDFLNADFLDSDNDDNDDFNDDDRAKRNDDNDDDDDMGDDGDSSEEEDEDALDPRYMTTFPSLGGAADDNDDDDANDDNSDADDDDDDVAAANAAALADQEDDDDDDATGVGRTTLTMALLQQAEADAYAKHSVNGLRRMLKIFSDACRSSDAADNSKDGEIMYEVQSSAVYNRLMLSVFRKTHVAFARLVAPAASEAADEPVGKDGKVKVDDRKWKKQSLLIRRFFSCACYLLEQTTGQDIQLFVLRELAAYIPFAAPCPKTARRLLKALLKLWAKSLNTNVCMLAFVRIRDLALTLPFPFLELALKGLYISYMRNTKFTNDATLPHHVLMGNCVVELYGIDLSSSYQHAFIYIRQLAIAIRKTITSPSPETFKAVLNWQFFNQLRVWTAVVSAYPAESQLQPLVYPLCQLLFALVRLSSTIKYAPMRFQCVKLLQQLAFATGSFVPTSPVLLEVLTMPPFSTLYSGNNKLKASKEIKAKMELDLDLCVKLAKSNTESKRVHDMVIAKVFELLQRECDVYKFHVGFPEFVVPLVLTLKKFADVSGRVPKWASLARGLVESLKKRADVVRIARSQLDVAPKDIAQLDAFMQPEREAAVKKLFAADVAELQKKIASGATATGSIGSEKPTASATSDSDADSDDDEDMSENKTAAPAPVKIGKKKQAKLDAIAGRRPESDGVDDATFNKVQKMSLSEFKQSVAAVDEADQVEDFTFSDDE